MWILQLSKHQTVATCNGIICSITDKTPLFKHNFDLLLFSCENITCLNSTSLNNIFQTSIYHYILYQVMNYMKFALKKTQYK